MGKDDLVFLMRISLPDRPGSLGAVATALGEVGADIHSVEIVQKADDVVVDDFIVDLPPGKLPDSVVSACNGLPAVRVEWISRYPEGGGLQSDLEALERMTKDPANAAETLVSSAPAVFRSHWAVLVGQANDSPTSTFNTPLAPDLDAAMLAQLAPFDTVHRLDVDGAIIPGWGESTVVISPLSQGRAIVIGRMGGPAFLDSEVARLKHLSALVQ